MSAMQVIGWSLLILPFAAFFAFAWRELGFWVAVGLYLGVAALYGVVSLGIYLANGGAWS